MAGRGPAPKPTRRRANTPVRGEWQSSEGAWQHGDLPNLPAGMTAGAKVAWKTWFAAWFASHWLPSDLPGLRQTIRLYDQVERGEFTRMTELRQMMDNYGITPKGQQDRHWAPPKADEQPEVIGGDEYDFLRVVS